MEQACTDVSATICDKVFTCPEGALARVLLGGSLEACTPVARGFCPMCMPDQTYHGDKAYQCVQAIKQVMCSSIPGIVATGDPVAQFPVCGEICTGGSGGDAAAGQ